MIHVNFYLHKHTRSYIQRHRWDVIVKKLHLPAFNNPLLWRELTLAILPGETELKRAHTETLCSTCNMFAYCQHMPLRIFFLLETCYCYRCNIFPFCLISFVLRNSLKKIKPKNTKMLKKSPPDWKWVMLKLYCFMLLVTCATLLLSLLLFWIFTSFNMLNAVCNFSFSYTRV